MNSSFAGHLWWGHPLLTHIREYTLQSWGPFLEIPGNVSGPKSNFQIEIWRIIRARVLANKLLHFFFIN